MVTGILEQPAVQVKGMTLGCDPFTSRTYLSMRTSSFYDLNERLGCSLMYFHDRLHHSDFQLSFVLWSCVTYV